MRILVLSICLVLFSFSCKTKKTQAETVENSGHAKTSMEAPAEKPVEGSLSKQNRSQSKLPDSLFARIQRTACFGRCPIYTLSIYESGYAEYVGKKWVDKEGQFEARVPQTLMDELIEEAKAIDYFELNHEYDSDRVTDLPSTIINLKNEEGFYTVVGRYQSPQRLIEFAERFDQLFENVDWTKKE